MINHIIKRSKLVQKEYKTKLYWVGKVIYWELYKRLKFDHTTKWCTPRQPESVLENEAHKIFGDFPIKKWDNLIPVRRPDLVLIKKKKEKEKEKRKKKERKKKERRELAVSWILPFRWITE